MDFVLSIVPFRGVDVEVIEDFKLEPQGKGGPVEDQVGISGIVVDGDVVEVVALGYAMEFEGGNDVVKYIKICVDTEHIGVRVR